MTATAGDPYTVALRVAAAGKCSGMPACWPDKSAVVPILRNPPGGAVAVRRGWRCRTIRANSGEMI